eukprot:2463126-Rhodomonas_salina.2
MHVPGCCVELVSCRMHGTEVVCGGTEVVCGGTEAACGVLVEVAKECLVPRVVIGSSVRYSASEWCEIPRTHLRVGVLREKEHEEAQTGGREGGRERERKREREDTGTDVKQAGDRATAGGLEPEGGRRAGEEEEEGGAMGEGGEVSACAEAKGAGEDVDMEAKEVQECDDGYSSSPRPPSRIWMWGLESRVWS